MLKELHQITTDSGKSFDQKVQLLLALGCRVFSQQHGIVSRIEGNVYTIKHVVSDDAGLQPGLQFEVANTYCVHTLNAGHAMTFSHVGNSAIAVHPCYATFKLESYIGVSIQVKGQLYGTLNFSSAQPRTYQFTEADIDFINLFAQWIGNEIGRLQDQQLLERRLELQQQMEQLADIGCWEVDCISSTLYWSAQTRVIHEVPDDYVPDLDSAIGFYPEGEDRDKIVEVVDKAMREGTSWDMEIRLQTHTGKMKWVATRGRAIMENGVCVRIIGAFQDIDAQVNTRNALIEKKNEAQRLLIARSQMIGKVSHELRTPINGITGMLQTLVGENNPDIIESRVAIALRSADLLVRLVNDVLDYSKVESGELELESVRFSPKHIFDDLYSLYHPMCDNKNIDLDFRVSLPEGTTVNGDPGRLTQVFSNLLNNAIKFTAEGGVKLTAKIKQEADNTFLQVGIIDSGIGMNEATQANLFVPFKQGSASITTKYGGSGLGLAIVKELCVKFNAELRVKSSEGIGTQVHVKMPLTLAQSDVAEPIEDYVAPQSTSFDSLSILVVDDNDINRLVMESLLSQLSINADYAVNGLEAVKSVQREQNKKPYNLIFMDCEMPIMGGIEATLAIRQSQRNTGKTFIVAMTADTSDANRRACLKAGMDSFMTKPVKLEDVRALLKKVAFPEVSAFQRDNA